MSSQIFESAILYHAYYITIAFKAIFNGRPGPLKIAYYDQVIIIIGIVYSQVRNGNIPSNGLA